jgi:CRP-like cAMP-binding protein
MPDRTDEQWEKLVAHSERRTFRAGDEVIRRGEIDRALYIVLAGDLEMRLSEGRRSPVLRVPTGSVIGEIAFFDGKARSTTVRAATDVEVLRLSLDEFNALAAEDSSLARAMLFDLARILATRLRQTDEFIRGWLG